MHIVWYISAGMIWFYLCCFLCSAVHAQESKPRKYSLELHILEPSMLVLNRSISKSGNWSIVLGAGFSGKFYNQYLATPNELKKGFIGMSYDGRVYDVGIRKYFNILNQGKLGVFIQSGLQYRQIQWSGKLFSGDIPTIYHQVLPYLRAGIFYRPSNKFELGTLAGIGVHVYDVTGITEFMVSGFVGYKFGRVKPK